MTSNSTSIRGYFSGGILSYGNRAGINLVNGNIGITIDLVRIATTIYMSSNATGIREWICYGQLRYGIAFGGLSSLYISDWLNYVYWTVATIREYSIWSTLYILLVS